MNTRSSFKDSTIAIIGGGITGLVAAQGLLARGAQVCLLEQSARLGGSIGSESIDGWLVEAGPNTILDGEPVVRELVTELGLQDEVVYGSETAKKRFIVRDGRVQAMPSSPPSLFSTKLFSWSLRLGIFKELLQQPRVRDEDTSLAEIIRDHFGQEAVDYALNPFVGGVYAGDPNLLSAKYSFPAIWKAEQEKGSIIRGLMAAGKERKARGGRRPKIMSFRRGLQTLVDALSARIPETSLHLDTAVLSVKRENGQWRLGIHGPRGDDSMLFDQVVFAVPAHALARIVIEGDPARTSSFADVVHPPVASLFLGYKREQITHPLDGFGVLIPGIEKRNELGVLFSSSLFPGRAPSGHVALTVMVGGMRQPEIARLSPEALLERVRPDLEELLGVSGEPCFVRHRLWTAAIPQYNLGYGKYLERFKVLEDSCKGLHFVGNARQGIAVPNCMDAGRKMVAGLAG